MTAMRLLPKERGVAGGQQAKDSLVVNQPSRFNVKAGNQRLR